MKYFIQWLIIFSLVILGSFVIWYAGLIEEINKADITKLTFAIYLIFIYRSLKIGALLFKWSSFDDDTYHNYYFENYEKAKNFANWFVKLGLIGTVIGFIYMLSSTFITIDAGNVASMQSALVNMATGMGTALYTTASGLICSLILQVQIFVLKNCVDG